MPRGYKKIKGRIQITDDTKDFHGEMIKLVRVSVPEAMKRDAGTILDITIHNVKRYIPDEKRQAPGQLPTSLSTGQLKRSFGTIGNTNVWGKKGRNKRIYIEAGTHYDYAHDANYGIPNIPYGYTLTAPYHFIEKGKVDTEVELLAMFKGKPEFETIKLIVAREKRRIKRLTSTRKLEGRYQQKDVGEELASSRATLEHTEPILRRIKEK